MDTAKSPHTKLRRHHQSKCKPWWKFVAPVPLLLVVFVVQQTVVLRRLEETPKAARPQNEMSGIPTVFVQGTTTSDTSIRETTPAGGPPTMKIVTFSDRSYVPLAMRWYDQMTSLGYTEHVIVAVDKVAFDKLKAGNYRVEHYIPKKNNKWVTKIDSLEQFWYRRISYVKQKVRKGISVLLTDSDNFFSRYVPLSEFQNSGYDVIHSYAMRFPDDLFNQYGLVVCGCLTWYTATARTLAFLDLVQKQCNKNCDDQKIINKVLLNATIGGVVWENREAVVRVNSSDASNGLMETGMVGRSSITGHTVKIWDRDFAWRGPVMPQTCPSKNNWVAMPAGDPPRLKQTGRAERRFERIDFWERTCGKNGSPRSQRK